MVNAFYHNHFLNDDFVRIPCQTDLSFHFISLGALLGAPNNVVCAPCNLN